MGIPGVFDEQAAPAIASAATVVRRKRLDVMRFFLFGRSAPVMERPRGIVARTCELPRQRRLSSAVA
jgi:hypothetical protein